MRRCVFLVFVLQIPINALAQVAIPTSDAARLSTKRAPTKDSTVSIAAASNPSLLVSKTARVEGPDVCGVIRITNTGFGPVTVSGIADSLEVHFPNNVPPPGLTAGSTPNWFKVADVPIALPGPIAPRTTATIPYCFSICQARDYPGANSMRNVVAVFVGTRWWGARSNSFAPPFLDCEACCLPDGSCADSVPERCAGEGGLPRGTSTDCATTECTQACCLGNGTCEDRTLSACGAGDGSALGLGTRCESANCLGACCDFFSGPACFNGRTKSDCELNQGTFLGFDTSCETQFAACPTGGCCRGPDDCIDFMTESGCDIFVHGAFLGIGTTCETAETTCLGACCDFFSGPACFNDFTKAECELDQGGTFLGLDTSCETERDACPTGACCSGFGNCVDLMTAGGCSAFLQGTFLGIGTTCDSVVTTCRGACCDPLSGPACFNDFTKVECELDQGGTFLGLDTTCQSELAACPTGACCSESGNCADRMSETGCSGFLHGTFLGTGTTCAPSSCTGACCFGESCEVLLPGDCEARGGDPQGPGTDCPIPGIGPCDRNGP